MILFIEPSSNGNDSELHSITVSFIGYKSVLLIGVGKSFQKLPFEYVQSKSKVSIL